MFNWIFNLLKSLLGISSQNKDEIIESILKLVIKPMLEKFFDYATRKFESQKN